MARNSCPTSPLSMRSTKPRSIARSNHSWVRGSILKFHARRVAQNAHQPNRLIGERVNRERANFLLLEVGQAVRRIEQQPARLHVQRNGDGVDARSRAAANLP